MQYFKHGWQINFKSLTHSVTTVIPNYAMQTAKLPMHICNRLDKLNRNFLRGDDNNAKKVHLVNWHIVCLPKSFGGLGI